MTVGISLTNGKDAITITDSQVLGSGRKSDSVNKTGIFCKENYHGVVYGAGEGNVVLDVIRGLGSFNGSSYEEFVAGVYEATKGKINEIDDNWLQRERAAIHQKAAVIQDDGDKRKFVRRNTQVLLDEFDKVRETDQTHRTSFIATGYDKSTGSVRSYSFGVRGMFPIHIDHIEIGSGSDGADMYFASRFQGLDPRKLAFPDLAFFAGNAYSNSTTSQGVGGTPQIVIIDKDNVRPMDTDKALILANLSGAYLAGFSPDLTTKKSRQILNELFSERRLNVKGIAKLLGLNEETLLSTYIPFSSWMERTNRREFGNISRAL